MFVTKNHFGIIVLPLRIKTDDNIFYENESTSLQILLTTCSLESRFIKIVFYSLCFPHKINIIFVKESMFWDLLTHF